MVKRWFGMILVILPLLACAYVQAAIVVDETTRHFAVSDRATFLRDKTGALVLDDVMRAEHLERFLDLGGAVNFGFINDAIWARFDVKSDLPRDSKWLLALDNPRTQEVDWYLVRGDGRVEHSRMGMLMDYDPAHPRLFAPAIGLKLSAGEELKVFVRCKTETTFAFHLSLHDPAFYAEQVISESFWLIFLFGCLAILFVLALTFAVFSKERGYLTYALNVAAVFVIYFVSTGYWRWLEWPFWRFWTFRGVIWIFAFVFIFTLLYLRDFFDFRLTAPRLNKLALVLVGIYALLIPASLFGSFRFWVQWSHIQAIVAGVLCLTISARYAWKGDFTARVYFFSWVQFWVLVTIQILGAFGFVVLPFHPQYLGMSGLVGGYTLFFIAMVYRVRQLRLEREREREGYYQGIDMLMRDLHDGVGGIVAGIGMLGEIGRRAGDVKGKDEYLSRICDLAAVGNAEVRSLIGTLESQDMNWPDLITELRRYGETLLENHDIAFEMKLVGEVPDTGPGLLAGMSLFRIFKEALNNVIKHSGATAVDAELSFGSDGMRLVVHDNGRGMDGAAASVGHGMRNMRKRIEELGGVIKIEKSNGCLLIFQAGIPLRSPYRGIDATLRV